MEHIDVSAYGRTSMFWAALGLLAGLGSAGWLVTTGRPSWPLSGFCLGWFFLEALPAEHGRSSLLAFFRAAAAASIGALLAAGMVAAVQGLSHIPWTFSTSTLISGREILKIWLLAHGKTIYPLIGEYPFLVTLYTPLFFVLGAGLTAVFENPVLAGRILSALPFFCMPFFACFWIRRSGGTWIAALLAVALLMTAPELAHASTMIRPDWLAWLLVYSGAFTVMTGEPTMRRMALGAVLLGCAALTKQQTAPVILAVATAWVTDRSLARRALFSCALAGGILLAGALVAEWLAGGSFLIHTLRYPMALAGNEDITNWSFAEPRLKLFAMNNLPALLAWVAALATNLARRRTHWLDWVLLIQIPFTIRLSMTWGASDNYFWGFLVALYVRLGLFFTEVSASRAILVPVVAAFFLMVFSHRDLDVFQEHISPEEIARFQRDTEIISRSISEESPVLMNAELASYFLPRQITPALHFFDSIELQFFEQAGFFSFISSTLARDIADRKFSPIILGNTFIKPSMKDFVEYFYSPVLTSVAYTMYSPKPGKCVLYGHPTDKPVIKDGLRIQVSRIDGVHANQGFGGFSFSRNETANNSYIEFTLEKNSIPEMIHAILHPKVSTFGPGNSVGIEWSEGEGPFHPLQSSGGTKEDTSNRLGATPYGFHFSSASPVVRVRFVLEGTGQIWFSPDCPILFRVTPLEH